MTRQEQIEIAAEELCSYDDYLKDKYLSIIRYNFLIGAEWADANPINIIHTWPICEYNCREKIPALEAKLAIAVSALEEIGGPDSANPQVNLSQWLNAWRNDTKENARKALAKIQGDE